MTLALLTNTFTSNSNDTPIQMTRYVIRSVKTGQLLRGYTNGKVELLDNKKGPSGEWELIPFDEYQDPRPPTDLPTVSPITWVGFPLPVSTLGDWRGHFLTSRWFFGPAIVARPDAEQTAYFAWLASERYRHVLINAEQHDWGPSKSHPEWTAGGTQAHDRADHMDRVVATLHRARLAGLMPLLGVFDQPSIRARSVSDAVRLAQKLVDRTSPWVSLYMLSWEINEAFRSSQEREDWEDRLIGGVDWKGRDVGLHYSAASRTLTDEDPGLGGGINRYRALEALKPDTGVTRLLQWHNEATWEVLIEQTRRTAQVVHQDHGLGKFCAFEFASERNQPKEYTPAQVVERRQRILGALDEIGLPPSRCGFMN